MYGLKLKVGDQVVRDHRGMEGRRIDDGVFLAVSLCV